MDFKQFEENVSAYVEGLLDEKMMRAMDAKKAESAECNNLALLHENILAALENTEPLKAPAGLGRRILAAVEAEEAETSVLQKTRRRALAVSLSAAAALLAGLVPFMVGALKQSAAGISGAASSVSGASEGLSVITVFTARWLAGIETMFFIATDSNRWPTLARFLEFVTRSIAIPNIDISIPGYVPFAMVTALAVLAWTTREYFGKQHKMVLSSIYRRSF